MTKANDILREVDDYGLVTVAEARALGVSNVELVQMAKRGKLSRVARGVYRAAIWPYQEKSSYAIAVKAVGEDAYLFGESVVALLELAPTDPRRIWIATPRRVRRDLGAGVRVVQRRTSDDVTFYEAIPCQSIDSAIVWAAKTMGTERARDAAKEAVRRAYISKKVGNDIEKELRSNGHKAQ